MRVEFLLALALEVLPFDALVAGGAGAAVEFVVVAFAVGRVVDYVEGGGLEGFLAGVADETVFVVSTG